MHSLCFFTFLESFYPISILTKARSFFTSFSLLPLIIKEHSQRTEMQSLPEEKMALLGTVYITLNIWFFNGSMMKCVVLWGPGSFFIWSLFDSMNIVHLPTTLLSPYHICYSILSQFPLVDIAIINVCYLDILSLLLYLPLKHWIFPFSFVLCSLSCCPCPSSSRSLLSSIFYFGRAISEPYLFLFVTTDFGHRRLGNANTCSKAAQVMREWWHA